MGFKVGDKVEFINNYAASIPIGETGVVQSVDQEFIYVKWDNPRTIDGNVEWLANRFKLVPVVPDEPMKTCSTCDSFQEGGCSAFGFLIQPTSAACRSYKQKEVPMTCSKCDECKNFEPKVDTAKVQAAFEKQKKLFADAKKVRYEADRLHKESNKLLDEYDKLSKKANDLYAEGEKHFFDVVEEVHGEAEINWHDYGDSCTIEGVTYKLK